MQPLLSLLSLLKALPTKFLERLRPPSEIHPETILPDTRQFLAAGKSAVVYGIDSERVIKEFHDCEAGKIERQVYQRLGAHPHIAKLLEVRTDGSIILERGTPLRMICRAPFAKEIPIQTKVHWLRHAAEGHLYLHNRNIIHGDIGCHNWILTGEDNIKLIDFEGCSIDGGPAGSCYEWFSYCPSMPRVSQRTDIFAFGCAIYEVLTGRPPHYEFETSDEPCMQVEELYATGHFPEVTHLPLCKTIQGCWYGDISSMGEIIQELEASQTKPLRWKLL
jgi:serine/threonine protein kinase